MSDKNKAILEAANAAIALGNYEEFLSFCTSDTQWTFVGDKTLQGKEAVRQWMATEYVEPPLNIVTNLIAEGISSRHSATSQSRTKTGMRLITRTAMSGAFAAARWSN